MSKKRTFFVSLVWAFFGALLSPLPVRAEVGPDGTATMMADFLVVIYLIFLLLALIVFLVAYKIGLFRNLEEAKYYMLEIDEPDYFTPEWAKEGDNEPDDSDG